MPTITTTAKGFQKVYGQYGNGNGATYTVTVTPGTAALNKYEVTRRPIRGGIAGTVATGGSSGSVSFTETARFDFEIEVWADVRTAGTIVVAINSTGGGDQLALATVSVDASNNPGGLIGPDGSVIVDVSVNLQQVATRCILPISRNAGIKQCMSRTVHVARDRVSRLKIIIPNFYMVTGVETAAGAATSVTASIEYPAGTYTQITFSGVATGSIADNSILVSDFCNVTIPQGAKFYTRIWRSNATAILFTGSSYPALTGDGFVSSGTTTPDLTMGGAVTQATVNVFAPCGIVAYTSRRNVAFIGDSEAFGTGETVTDGLGDVGYVARAVGPVAGYMNLSTPSDAINLFVTAGNRVNRTALAAYASDLIWVLGTNDVGGGHTAIQVNTNMQTGAALFPNQRSWVCTLPPRTTSTDVWVTTANQTATANESVRVTVNSNNRAVPTGFVGCFDVADAIETGRNTGIYRIDTSSASPALTADGIHPATKGHQLIARSGVINPAVFLAHG